MYHDQKVFVVVPVYNEEKLIASTLAGIPSYVDRIIVVDDASQDRSFEIVCAIVDKERSGRILLLKNDVNQGVGGAIARGYQECLTTDADIVVVMAGDGQMNPDDLPSLLEPIIKDRADYVKGNRLFTGEAYRKMPKLRYFGNAVLSFLSKIASGYWHVADSQSGYTALNRRVLEMIKWKKMYRRYGQPNDLLVRLNVFNFRVQDVPVKPIYNIGEKSGIKIRVVVFTISWLLVKLFLWRMKEKYVIRDFHPLVLFYAFGGMLMAISIVLFVRLCLLWFLNGHIPPINALAWMFSVSIGLQSWFFAMLFDMEGNRELK